MGLVSTLFVSTVVFVAGASAADLAKAEAGAMIYDAYCSACHGVELNNTAPGVTFDLRRLRTDERSRFVNSVLNGKPDAAVAGRPRHGADRRDLDLHPNHPGSLRHAEE